MASVKLISVCHYVNIRGRRTIIYSSRDVFFILLFMCVVVARGFVSYYFSCFEIF